MTVEQMHEIRKSFARLECQGDIVPLVFYRRLLELAPELRPHLQIGIQPRSHLQDPDASFITVLQTILANLEHQEKLELELRDLYLSWPHEIKDLVAIQSPLFKRAWLETLTGMLNAEFNPRLREAWTALCDELLLIAATWEHSRLRV